MKLATRSFVEHQTAGGQEMLGEGAGLVVALAPGLCTCCAGCSCCSCCSCGAATPPGT